MEKRKLPELASLHYNAEVAFKNDEFNLLLNQPPIEKWIKAHPTASGVKYLPIDKVEYLLTRIFQQWRVEVISYSQLFNSVSCHIRLHYLNPTDNTWGYHDGLGAVAVQTNKGKSAADLAEIKSNAVMLALPAAKSYAIKDAAEHLGSLFGRDLNRKDTVAFSGSYVSDKDGEELYKEIESQLDLLNSFSELDKYWEQMPEHHANLKVQQLFSKRKSKLK